jgi:hypothetical protein
VSSLPRDAPVLRPAPPLPASRAAGRPQTSAPRGAKSLEISTAARDRYPAPGCSAGPAGTPAPQPWRSRPEVAVIWTIGGAAAAAAAAFRGARSRSRARDWWKRRSPASRRRDPAERASAPRSRLALLLEPDRQ